MPAELVVEIFEICVQDAWNSHGVVGLHNPIIRDSDSDSDLESLDSDVPYEPRWLPKEYTWLNILLVCRTWRDLALHSSMLWTRIVVNNSRSVRIMLQRSAQLGIHIKNGAFLAEEDSLSLVFEQVHRLRTAHLRLSPSASIRRIFSFAKTPAGILETFDISVVGSSGHPETPFPDIQMPRLRSFTATSGSILPFVPLLPCSSSLRHLRFRRINPGGSRGLLSLLEILRSLPSLEELQVCNALTGASHRFHDMQWLDNEGQLNLPNLRHLEIDEADYYGPFGLLRSISIPGATLKLICGRHSSRTHGDTFEDIAVQIGRILRGGLASQTPMSLSITHPSTESRLHVNLRPLNESDGQSGGHSVLDLNLGPIRSHRSFQLLRQTLPRTARIVYIKCSVLEAESWWNIFGQLNGVEELHVFEYPTSFLPDALSPSPGSPFPGALLFPALRKLTLEEAWFGQKNYFTRLMDALSARQNAGAAKLELLELVNVQGLGKIQLRQLASLTPHAVSAIQMAETV